VPGPTFSNNSTLLRISKSLRFLSLLKQFFGPARTGWRAIAPPRLAILRVTRSRPHPPGRISLLQSSWSSSPRPWY
jgi:hypothetical protein